MELGWLERNAQTILDFRKQSVEHKCDIDAPEVTLVFPGKTKIYSTGEMVSAQGLA